MSNKIPATEIKAGPPASGRNEPVVCVYSIGDREAEQNTLQFFKNLGWQGWSPSGEGNVGENGGGENGESQNGVDDYDDLTITGPDQLGRLLIEHDRRHPGHPLLLVDAGLSVTVTAVNTLSRLMNELAPADEQAIVLTALSNANPGLNPYSGLEAPPVDESTAGKWESIVALLGQGCVYEHHHWPAHLLYFSARAVQVLAQADIKPANALSRLRSQNGRLLVADTCFVHDPRKGLVDQPRLEPHEQRRPPAWGDLAQRLDTWLRSKPANVDEFLAGDKPVTLHVTHSWGGGVAQWVHSFIAADEKGLNFQLRSEGPQSGEGAGQRLSLYFGNKTDAPVASWWLQPPIRSTIESSAQYRGILREISRRYAVGRIIVSSLVGHSLDVLGTELPTLQVLHDFYPCWPLLGIHPEHYLSQDEAPELDSNRNQTSRLEQALKQALSENSLLPDFRDRDTLAWKSLGDGWRQTVSTHNVAVTAPSRSVADLLRELDPAWSGIDIDIVPHGLPPFPEPVEVLPRDRQDGKLRLVIPGRMQEGKGQALLLEAIKELTQYAQVYLLGAGMEGEAFFGRKGVNVIVQYSRHELPALLANIGPHMAGLLSVVPETFSYTLSEMQKLNVPVMATRVGSFQERIEEGETGWLIEPNADSLIEKVRYLFQHRENIEAVRKRLAGYEQSGTSQMVQRYETLCLPCPAPQETLHAPDNASLQASSLSFQLTGLTTRIRKLDRQNIELQSEVEKRTAWATKEQRQLKTSQRSLEHEQAAHAQTHVFLAQLRAEHDWVLASTSWRITKPFRASRRILHNFKQARAWNPLRWPLLISQLVRTIRTQGLYGALKRSQLAHHQIFEPESIDTSHLEKIGNPDPPQSVPVSDSPEISIIIPVFNQWVYTAACLRSLANAACRTRFELILVDDQSSDETAERLADVKGLVCIRNENNLGFIGSCNRGAREAKGKYIVLLNNDTQVLDGWLDALRDTFVQFPDTGLAGACLIYPDGELQEAGGIVFNDGSGWNYGRGDNAEKPEYLYTREVDYCSGACIMLSTQLFRDLGGFDTHYSPAYYEDTDLAFRVRAKGLKVRVQPRATIVHHEGITSGTDINSGTKKYQAINRKKFLDRWQLELLSQPGPVSDPNDSQAVRQARDHRLKGRILVIDAYTPEPDQDSGSLRLRYLLDCFSSLGYGVTFFADNRGHAGAYTKDLQQAGVEVIYNPWLEPLHDFFSERGSEFDFVMISRHYIAANYVSLLQRYCPDAKFIFDTVDLHYLREERLAELEDSPALRRVAAQTRRSELAVIAAADATLVVSPVEKTVLEQAAPEAKVHVISNVHEVTGSQRPWTERKDIFFVGGYQHPPNVDAATWFVSSIWPLVHEQLPEIQFHLIGSKANEQVSSLHGNGVQFHGFVKSLEPWLDGCRLAVAPLRYGAGVKGKVNLSMSRGQPVVATPMAVEGIFAKPGDDILVAENAEDFAAEVVRLYRDEQLWNRISVAGLENVRQYFSVEAARLSLQNLLKSLA
jgi:GT2 family glycosyltransferase/glycosyltransferase involved in cell wall biosynthesis